MDFFDWGAIVTAIALMWMIIINARKRTKISRLEEQLSLERIAKNSYRKDSEKWWAHIRGQGSFVVPADWNQTRYHFTITNRGDVIWERVHTNS